MGDTVPGRGRASPEPIPEAFFRYLLDLEVEKAARLRYRVSVVCLVPDLPSGLYGQVPVRELSEHIARIALGHLRRTDSATTFPDGSVGFLLIDADPRVLSRIVGRAGGVALGGRARFAYRGETISVSGGGSCYPLTASTASAVLLHASELMRLAREAGGDRVLIGPVEAGTGDPSASAREG
jgi:hypothetical protein